MDFRADVFSSSSLAAEAVFRWSAFSFCRWPLDAQLCCSSCYFPRCFLTTLLHGSRLLWAQTNNAWLNRINCASPLPRGRPACARPPCRRGALPALDLHRHLWADSPTHCRAQGLRVAPQGLARLFAFSRCQERPSVLNINETSHSLLCRLEIFSIRHTVLSHFSQA